MPRHWKGNRDQASRRGHRLLSASPGGKTASPSPCALRVPPVVCRQTARADSSKVPFFTGEGLSRVFRGKFRRRFKIPLPPKRGSATGQLESLGQAKPFHAFLRQLFWQDWVVVPSDRGGRNACRYLARYTAWPFNRLVSWPATASHSDGRITRTATRSANDCSTDEFLRQFLLHVLPRGFVRIRHFGFLPRRRRESIAIIRQVLTGLLDHAPQRHCPPPPGHARAVAAP